MLEELEMFLFGSAAGLCMGICIGSSLERYRIDAHYVERESDDPFMVSDFARKARMNKMPLGKFKLRCLSMLALQVILFFVIVALAFIIGVSYVS